MPLYLPLHILTLHNYLSTYHCSTQTMVTSAPSKLLIGISLDPDDNRELLSWAISVLARPNDSIVAMHVLVGEERNKDQLTAKHQSHFRRAKAYVISVLGEFAKTCQLKQINLEAKVRYSFSVRRGLVEEAKSISADFILLGPRNRLKNRSWSHITRYCLEQAPEGCSVVSVGISRRAQQKSNPNYVPCNDDVHQLSSKWESNMKNEKGVSPAPQGIVLEQMVGESSPRTVLDGLARASQSTDGDSFSMEDSSITESPPLAPKHKEQAIVKKQTLSRKLISSLLLSPLRKKNSRHIASKENKASLLRCFSYEEISNATNDFHPDNIVGRGGYSEVYRGDLSDGRSIAVKRLAKDNKDQVKEKEFLMELGIIGHVCHPNTSSLVGCCIENGLYLVFNYSQNGNLASALHGNTRESLDWAVRYKIAIGIARGLHYLHKCCRHRIIHRDIKASNVLLGPEYEPQITDFGLAKWLPNKWTHHAVIPIEGTFGYLAPEYFMHGIVDEKTDVFAFGVLLLEIITGRKPVDSSKQSLLLWASPLMQSGDIAQLADPKLEGRYDAGEMSRVVLIASYCVRQSSIWRPSMSEVLELLTGGEDSKVAKTWRSVLKFDSDGEMDDYSMVFGYQVPTDIVLEDFL